MPTPFPARSPRRLPLRFGRGNMKVGDDVYTFSLPAGWTCPGAKHCLARADPNNGTITDGKRAEFRCYAASMEARHPSVRRARWHNLRQLRRARTREKMARLILDSLSPFAERVRIHTSGDFFSAAYFAAWLDVAEARPDTSFYFYTKCLTLWVDQLDRIGDGHRSGPLPNVVPTASAGGRYDALIREYGLRSATVVFSAAEAELLNLDIDLTDELAQQHGPDFALLLHGTQPANTRAGEASRALRDGAYFAPRLSLDVL